MKPLIFSVLPRPPHPTRDGLAIRNYYLLRALSDVFRVRCFALLPPHLSGDPGEYPDGLEVETIPQADRRLRAVRALAGAAVTGWPYPELLYRSSDLAQRVRASALSERPAWTIAHSYHVGPLAIESGRPAWVDFHNVESEIWGRMASTASSAGRRFFARWQAPRVRALEELLLLRAAGSSCVSGRDAAAFSALSPGAAPLVVPNGVDLERYSFRPEPAPCERVFFVGDLSWAPNAEGIRWLASEVWPILARQRPAATLEVLGRRTPGDLFRFADPRFTFLDETVDTRPHWREAAVAVVPLLAGGGTRLKILEAAACGVPVVSTRVGAEGLDFEPEIEILLRDSAESFAEAVAALLADPKRRADIARRARTRVETGYDWKRIGSRFAEELRSRSVR
ncbi:MAG TPA: glycosyltransferase [Thermoanaerobaculia bacterium]